MPHNYTFAQAGKMLGTGQNRLTKALRQRDILDRHNFPKYQRDITARRFVVVAKTNPRNPTWNNGRGQVYHQTKITQKGLIWLAELLGAEITYPQEDSAA